MADVQKNIVLLKHTFNELIEYNFSSKEIDAFYGILSVFNDVTLLNNELVSIYLEDLESRSFIGTQNRQYLPVSFYNKLKEKIDNSIYNTKTKTFVNLFEHFEVDWEERCILAKLSPEAFNYLGVTDDSGYYFKLYLNLLSEAKGRRGKRLYRLVEQWETGRTFPVNVQDFMDFVCAESKASKTKMYMSTFRQSYLMPAYKNVSSCFEKLSVEIKVKGNRTPLRQRFYFTVEKKAIEDIKEAKDNRLSKETETLIYETISPSGESSETPAVISVTSSVKGFIGYINLDNKKKKKVVEKSAEENYNEFRKEVENADMSDFVARPYDIPPLQKGEIHEASYMLRDRSNKGYDEYNEIVNKLYLPIANYLPDKNPQDYDLENGFTLIPLEFSMLTKDDLKKPVSEKYINDYMKIIDERKENNLGVFDKLNLSYHPLINSLLCHTVFKLYGKKLVDNNTNDFFVRLNSECRLLTTVKYDPMEVLYDPITYEYIRVDKDKLHTILEKYCNQYTNWLKTKPTYEQLLENIYKFLQPSFNWDIKRLREIDIL